MDVEAEAAAVALDRDSAFEQYVEVRQAGLLRLAYLLTGDQHAAEDLLQTTLAKLYLACNRVERAGSLDAYTRRIMVNERSSRWRRAAQRLERSTDAVLERPVPDDFDHTLAERDALWSVVRGLAPRQRATVVLRFYEDLSEQQVADLLGCSIGTVKSQTSRALATLRTRLEERKGHERVNRFDDLESALAAELRRRSGDVLTTPGLAGRARRHARVLRRRRVVAVCAVTAVAVAVAVPAALSLRPVPQTAPPAGPPAGGTTQLVLDGLPTGAPPSIGWFEDAQYHDPAGSTVGFPELWTAVLPVDGGFLASKGGDIARLGPDGEVTDRRPGAGPVLSPDGVLAAYYDRDAGLLIGEQADGGETGPGGRAVPDGQQLEPAGFIDGHRVVSNVVTASGARTGVRIDDLAPDAAPDAATPPWKLPLVSAVSPTAGLVTGPTSLADDACWAVYEADADEPLWETCEYALFRFSPDGRHLLGTTGRPDADAHAHVVAVDARTGELVHGYTGRHIDDVVFEDDDHLIVDVRLEDGDDRLATLLRCDLSGGCEVTRPVTGQDEVAYSLARQRW